jgi:hypothetical protein
LSSLVLIFVPLQDRNLLLVIGDFLLPPADQTVAVGLAQGRPSRDIFSGLAILSRCRSMTSRYDSTDFRRCLGPIVGICRSSPACFPPTLAIS